MTASIHTDTLDVFPRPRIDLDDVSFLDKPRDLELATCFQLGGFGNAGCRIPANPRFGFDHFEVYVRRGRYRDGIAVEENHGHGHPFLEVLPILIDLIGGQFVLFERLGVHEDKRTRLAVEKLSVQLLDVGNFEFIAPFERTVQDRVSDQIFQFALVESVPFSGFDEVHFIEKVRFAIDLNFKSFAEVAGFVRCHGVLRNKGKEGVIHSLKCRGISRSCLAPLSDGFGCWFRPLWIRIEPRTLSSRPCVFPRHRVYALTAET